MTARDWWLVASRGLGVYFVVMGVVTATGALMMTTMGLPEGTERATVVAFPIVQGVVLAIAGVWLVRQSSAVVTGDPKAPDASSHALRVGLQLLGAFLLISGLGVVLGAGVQSYFVGADWQFRASELVAGTVDVVAGGTLAFFPVHVAKMLHG